MAREWLDRQVDPGAGDGDEVFVPAVAPGKVDRSGALVGAIQRRGPAEVPEGAQDVIARVDAAASMARAVATRAGVEGPRLHFAAGTHDPSFSAAKERLTGGGAHTDLAVSGPREPGEGEDGAFASAFTAEATAAPRRGAPPEGGSGSST